MGIRKIQDANATLLFKLGWKVITDPHNVWFKVVFAKYLYRENFLEQKKLLMLQTCGNTSRITDIYLKKVFIGSLGMEIGLILA